jgi:hypothetical protein
MVSDANGPFFHLRQYQCFLLRHPSNDQRSSRWPGCLNIGSSLRSFYFQASTSLWAFQPTSYFCRSLRPLNVTLLYKPYYSITQPRRRHIAQYTLLFLYCSSLLRYSTVHSVQPGHASCAPFRGAQNRHQPCSTSTNKPYLTSCFRAARHQQNVHRSSRSRKYHEHAQSHYWTMEQPFRRRSRHLGLATTATDSDRMRCYGKRQHIRSHVRHLLVLHDETELPTRPGLNVNLGRLLQKLMVPDTRFSELCTKSSHQRRIFLPSERFHAADGTPGLW